MTAPVIHGRRFSVLEADGPIVEVAAEIPHPTGRGVVVEVTEAGVCHSDVHIREGGYHLGDGRMLLLAERGIPFPITMGHEIVGRVVAVGDEVTSTKVGDLRVVYPWIGCGNCLACREGHDPLCATPAAIGVARPGGYASHVAVPDEKYVLPIDGIDPAFAAVLACSGLTSYSATSKVLDGVEADDPIVVIGAGGVGQMAIATLAARGHRAIISVDVNERNLADAVRVGASATVLDDSGDPTEGILAAAGGRPVTRVIDFVGISATAAVGFGVLGKGGRLVLVGLFGGELTIPTVRATIQVITVQGSYLGDLSDLEAMLELARSGRLPQLHIEPGHLDASVVAESLNRLVAGGVSGRIVLSPSGESA